MPVHHDQTLQGDLRLDPDFTDQHVLDSDDEEYFCCSLEFDNELDHLSHMINHIAENIILLQRVQCDYCNYSFDNYNGLKRHLPLHLGYNCYYCQQHIPNWSQLVHHVMHKHNYKIKRRNKSNSNKQHKKIKRRATGPYIKNKKRFKRKFLTKVKIENSVPKIKTEQRNNFVSTIKTEPHIKSEPGIGANVYSEPMFNSSNIKTEPTDFKTEPFDYY